jgi:hypothetical protein
VRSCTWPYSARKGLARPMDVPSPKSLTGMRNRCMMWLMYEGGLRSLRCQRY